MLLDPNSLAHSDGLTRISSGEILILVGHESTAAIVQHPAHAELVTPGSAVGGSFDRDVSRFYSIGDVAFISPSNPSERQQAIKHRQSDITRMLQFWQEKDSLERTAAFLTLLCQRCGFDRTKDIPIDLLAQVIGANVNTIDRAWDRLLSIDITEGVVTDFLVNTEPPLQKLQLPFAQDPHSHRMGITNVFTPSTISGYGSSSLDSTSTIQPRKRRGLFSGKLLFLLTSLVLAGIGLLFYTLSNSMVKRPATVAKTPIVTAKQKPRPVSALGYIEPKGRVVMLSAPAFLEGSRVEQLLVRQGDLVKQGSTIAVLDNRDRLQSVLEQAQQNVKIAEAKLQQVKAGSKTGEIRAQQAKSRQSKAELEGQISGQKAAIANVQAQLEGERNTQASLILEIKAELSHAKTECNRYQTLVTEGVVSKSQRDTTCLLQSTAQERLAQANSSLDRIIDTRQKQIREANANLKRTVDTLQNEIAAAEAATEAVSEVRPVDIQLANQEIISAKAAVKKAQADLAQAYVRAPMTGQVLKIETLPGELVNQQKGIIQLGQTDQMYVNANIYETDIARVRTGQKVTIRADGVVGTLRGYVDRVGIKVGTPSTLGTDPVKEADVRVVEVKIRLIPQDSQKVRNLTNLQVNVVINTSS